MHLTVCSHGLRPRCVVVTVVAQALIVGWACLEPTDLIGAHVPRNLPGIAFIDHATCLTVS